MILDLAKKTLSYPVVFDTYQTMVGSPRAHRRIIAEMVRPKPEDRLLDIGCGVGAIVPFLPADIDYVGIDISPDYIAKARKDYPGRRTFVCTDVAVADAAMLGSFDIAVSFGVFHHVPDDVARQMAALVRRVVKPGGRFVTIDPCYVPGQNRVAKILIDNDRGKFVRDAAGYRAIVDGLGLVQSEVHHDLLRIPYTQIVMDVTLAP
ncbi:MAG TPA: class I SAM-dependent methyltransferase [Rhizomicrobium sp.]|nr:class I SAM-dependent methyltransferase [Rhizomicrobium sp.]